MIVSARRFRRLVAIALGVVLAIVGFGGLVGCSRSDDTFDMSDAPSSQPATYSYTIPLGAGQALDQGEPLEVLPGELDVRVGEVIEIVNDDDRGHLVGPFYVGAHETLRQAFTQPGEFIGTCTVHPSGELVLEVSP